MGEQFLRWAWVRFRPEEGWLSFVLLLSAVGIFISAVIDANWVGPDEVVRVTGIVGFLVALYLVRRVRSAVWGWVLIVLSAIASTLLYLIQFSPLLLLTDRAMFWYEIKRGSLVLAVNLLRWLLVLMRGGQGRGSAAFAVMLGLVAALVCAYLVWSAYRQRQPLRGLLLMGVLLGINNYFGGGAVWTTAMFMGVLVLATATLRFAHLQMYWQTNHIDYSEEIKPQLIFIALGLGVAFWLTMTIVPQVRPTEWARAFQELTAVRELEADLERLFGDVQTSGPAAAVQYPAVSGVFPRSYLMGDPPDLARIPVFTAEVYTTTERIVAGSPVALHWRGNSYDIYTGSGWNTSAEEEQTFSANEPLPVAELASETTITQTVQWQLNSPIVTFYMLGFPEQVNQASTFRSFNNSEFARLQSTTFRNEGIRNYTVVSRLTVSDPTLLRQSSVADVPADLLAHYTQLPESVPERVHEMGRQLTAEFDNPYDKALAIERFLRQYPYNLNVAAPPRGFDPVDYFLFELQEGYCDYYASSMVVLARSVGLPARLGVGYATKRPDENGVQTITQKDGHSWAEIYFADYGWVEFEPTAAFPVAVTDRSGFVVPLEDQDDELFPSTDLPAPPPIPEQTELTIQYWQWAVLLLPFVGVLVYWLYQRRQQILQQRDDVLWGFGRLQRVAGWLGYAAAKSETPQEFTDAFTAALTKDNSDDRGQKLITSLRPRLAQLTTLYEQRQFDKPKEPEVAQRHNREARQLWRFLERPLLRLWWQRLFRRKKSE